MRTILYEVVDGERYARGHLASLELHRAARPAGVAAQHVGARDWDALIARGRSAGRTERDELPYEVDGLVIKVDDFAQRAALGTTVEVPALGDRVQVPGAPGHDDRSATSSSTSAAPARSRRSRSSIRSTSRARRCRARRSTTGIRSRGSGSASGDRVLIEKAGEIIPQILGVTEKGAGPGVRGADAVPVVRQPRSSARRARSRSLCPNRLGCPAQQLARDRVLRVARPDEHRRPRREGRRAAGRGRARRTTSPICSMLTVRAARRSSSGSREQSAKNLVAAIAKAKQAATFSRLLAALGIPHVGGVLAQADRAEVRHAVGAARRGRREGHRGVRRGAVRDRRHRRDHRARASIASCATRTSRAVLDKLAARGVDPAEPVVAVAERPARRQDVRRHRHADRAARRGPEADRGRGRQGRRLGQQEDQLPGRRRRHRQDQARGRAEARRHGDRRGRAREDPDSRPRPLRFFCTT